MQKQISLESDAFKGLIHTSASLRGQGKFTEAITTVESKLPALDKDCLTNAYLEIIYAAEEGDVPETARKYATLLADIDPNIPVVKKILGR